VEDLKSKLKVDAKLIIGNSTNQDVIAKARKLGPYDVVFIDGDGTYDGVLRDWYNYGPMAKKLVVFHNIINTAVYDGRPGLEVSKVWDKIKSTESTIEFAETWAYDKKGIGVVVL